MRSIKEKIVKNKNGAGILFVFFDLESQQRVTLTGNEGVKVHVPNSRVVQQCCEVCVESNDISVNCAVCGQREFIFKRIW